MEPLILLFWTSSDVSSGFQNQSGQPYFCLAEANVLGIPCDSPLVQHLPTSWQPVWQLSQSLSCTCKQALVGLKTGTYCATDERSTKGGDVIRSSNQGYQWPPHKRLLKKFEKKKHCIVTVSSEWGSSRGAKTKEVRELQRGDVQNGWGEERGADECDQREARAAIQPPATGPDRGSGWGWVGRYPASLMSAISGKLEQQSNPLPQDLTEGVDEDEWVGTLLH